MFLRNDLFYSITKNEHLHVSINLDLGMSKDVSGLSHMVLVARGFLLVVFACKEPYKYGTVILHYNYINVFYNLANLKLNFIRSLFYNFYF